MASRCYGAADAPYEALVVWWDCHTIAVLCPLCDNVEEHEPLFGPKQVEWDTSQTLNALCRSSNVEYQVVFPWKTGLGWEKNWARKRLETVGLDLPELEIRESWQPTSLATTKLSLRGRQGSLNTGGRVARDMLGDPLLFPEARRLGNREGDEEQTEKWQKVGSTSGAEMAVSHFTPLTILGDMSLMTSQRPKSNWIQILAPAVTVGGISLPGPLATINSHLKLLGKTVAILDRGEPYSHIIAVSGWKDSLSGPESVINQEKWSQQVHILGEYITHKLNVNNLDKGTEGRVSGSHAEKQVIAFFVRMHRFLEDGFEGDEMNKLRTLPSHAGLREAWIAVDNTPCDDCIAFKSKVEAVCKVKFHFVRMKDDFRSKKDRKNGHVEEPKTPFRPKTKRFPLPTPPDSDAPLLEKDSQRLGVNGDLEDNSDGDPQSPCHRRNLRSLAAKPLLATAQDFSCPSSSVPAPYNRKLSKRQRAETPDDTFNELVYSPPSPSCGRNPSRARRSKRSTAPAPEPRTSPPTPSRTSTPHTPAQHQPRHYGHENPSAEEVIAAAINAVAAHPTDKQDDGQALAPEREQAREEEDDDAASAEANLLTAAHSLAAMNAPSERVVIDLTGEGDTTDDDDSEVSCFSP